MCSKFILQPCKIVFRTVAPLSEVGKVLIGAGHGTFYLGDAEWEHTSSVGIDGMRRIIYTVTDHHNIDKAILLLRHRDPNESLTAVMRGVRDLLSNQDIPYHMITSRHNSLEKHEYLDGKRSRPASKGYEVLIRLNGEWDLRSHLPINLKEAIRNMGNDLLKKCA